MGEACEGDVDIVDVTGWLVVGFVGAGIRVVPELTAGAVVVCDCVAPRLAGSGAVLVVGIYVCSAAGLATGLVLAPAFGAGPIITLSAGWLVKLDTGTSAFMLDFTAAPEAVDVTGCLVILAALLTGSSVNVAVGTVASVAAGFIVEPIVVALTVAFVSGLAAGATVVLVVVFIVALAAGAATGLAAGFMTWLDKASGSLAGSAEAGTGVDCTGVTGVVGLGAGLTGCCSTGGKNGLVALLLA